MIAHAGLLAQRIGGRWKGALIEGPSGAGKSDLALKALDAGFRLVADDRVMFQAGTHADAVTMTLAEYRRLAQPEMAHFGRPMA